MKRSKNEINEKIKKHLDIPKLSNIINKQDTIMNTDKYKDHLYIRPDQFLYHLIDQTLQSCQKDSEFKNDIRFYLLEHGIEHISKLIKESINNQQNNISNQNINRLVFGCFILSIYWGMEDHYNVIDYADMIPDHELFLSCENDSFHLLNCHSIVMYVFIDCLNCKVWK